MKKYKYNLKYNLKPQKLFDLQIRSFYVHNYSMCH